VQRHARPWVVAFSEAVRIPAAVLGPVDLLALALLARRFLGLVMLVRLELHGAKLTAQEFVIELHALDAELAVDEHLIRGLKAGEGPGFEGHLLVQGHEAVTLVEEDPLAK